MSLFRRRKPSHPVAELPVVKTPALDAARARLAELNREANERIDRLLSKLRARELEAETEGKTR